MTFLICASCIAQDSPFVVVLGTIQDAGSPQIGCEKKCCEGLFVNPRNDRKVASLGLIDPTNAQIWLIDATPDYPSQLRALRNHAPFEAYEKYTGIFLTHAHIGHYTGLMYLGKEALNANKVYVHAMPRMKSFLETNGPWNQLVSKENIVLADLSDATDVTVSFVATKGTTTDKVKFYINRTLVGTHTTNVPTANMAQAAAEVSGNATGTKSMSIDYIMVAQDRGVSY